MFKKKWDELENSTTKNNPLKFTKYFAKYKEIQLRNKMAKYVPDRAGVGRGFGQNPIEWMHYMSKVEIDELGDGVSHRHVSLTTALRSLKGRILRQHKDPAKALYGDGPYRLDKAYTATSAVTYDEWQDLLPGERKALLKRFFTEVYRPVVTNEGKQMESSPQVAKVTPCTPETQSFRRLSVAVEEFGKPSEVVPATTLKDMFRHQKRFE